MCKILTPEWQLEEEILERCIRCGTVKAIVSARVVQIYQTQVKQHFCSEHCGIELIKNTMRLRMQRYEQKINEAIAECDSWQRPYEATEVYRESGINFYRLTEQLDFAQKIRKRAVDASQGSRIAEAERQITQAIAELSQNDQPLTLLAILRKAEVTQNFLYRHKGLHERVKGICEAYEQRREQGYEQSIQKAIATLQRDGFLTARRILELAGVSWAVYGKRPHLKAIIENAIVASGGKACASRQPGYRYKRKAA